MSNPTPAGAPRRPIEDAPVRVMSARPNLVTRLRRSVETAVREGRLGYEESGRLLRFYEEGLHGYTYLEDPHVR